MSPIRRSRISSRPNARMTAWSPGSEPPDMPIGSYVSCWTIEYRVERRMPSSVSVLNEAPMIWSARDAPNGLSRTGSRTFTVAPGWTASPRTTDELPRTIATFSRTLSDAFWKVPVRMLFSSVSEARSCGPRTGSSARTIRSEFVPTDMLRTADGLRARDPERVGARGRVGRGGRAPGAGSLDDVQRARSEAERVRVDGRREQGALRQGAARRRAGGGGEAETEPHGGTG